MKLKKKTIIFLAICILILCALIVFSLQYNVLHSSDILTTEQEELLHSSTLDLTCENLLDLGFSNVSDFESSNILYTKGHEKGDLSALCNITFNAQENMKKYDYDDTVITTDSSFMKVREKRGIRYYKTFRMKAGGFDINIILSNYQKSDTDIWDIISSLLIMEMGNR